MTLINGLLALGGLAFAIPLAIHLFYRSRFRTVDWGAMHLIEGMMRTNRRRMQWMNLLLLLVRCSVPILLAFCLARPLLTGFQALPGDAAQSVVIAIDDSRSMGFANSGSRTRMDDARNAINRVLDSLTRRDEIILIRSSDLTSPIISLGPTTARASVKSTVPHSGPVDLAALIRSATAAAKQASEPNPRVIVVSDFQNNMVDDASLVGLQRTAETIESQNAGSLDRKPTFEFLSVALDDSAAQPANVSIDSMEMESAAAVVGRRALLSTRIRNHGDDPVEGANLVWSVDGKREPPRAITIPERSFVSAKFDRVFESAGEVVITASIEFPDSLAADNRRTWAVDVIEQVDVWLVDDTNQSRFLEIALSPFALNSDPVRTTQLLTTDLLSKFPGSKPDVLVLTGMTDGTTQLREVIGDYISDGGSLILFNRSEANRNVLNQPWGSPDRSFQLPAESGEFVGTESLDGTLFPIAQRNANYSAWSLFGDVSRDLFSDVQVSGYRQLRLRSDLARNESTTLISLASGDPLIVLSKQGQGRIVQFAIAADTKGSTLPLRPVFVPMMQQLVLDLAGSRRRLNFTVGEPLVIPASELTSADKGPFWITRPGKDERSISSQPSDDGPTLATSNTSTPGVYRFRSIDESQAVRVMEVPPSESSWRGVDPARLDTAAETIGATVYGESESMVDDDRIRRYGREIWRWVLLALLVAMITELWISQRLGQQADRPQLETA